MRDVLIRHGVEYLVGDLEAGYSRELRRFALLGMVAEATRRQAAAGGILLPHDWWVRR